MAKINKQRSTRKGKTLTDRKTARFVATTIVIAILAVCTTFFYFSHRTKINENNQHILSLNEAARSLKNVYLGLTKDSSTIENGFFNDCSTINGKISNNYACGPHFMIAFRAQSIDRLMQQVVGVFEKDNIFSVPYAKYSREADVPRAVGQKYQYAGFRSKYKQSLECIVSVAVYGAPQVAKVLRGLDIQSKDVPVGVVDVDCQQVYPESLKGLEAYNNI